MFPGVLWANRLYLERPSPSRIPLRRQSDLLDFCSLLLSGNVSPAENVFHISPFRSPRHVKKSTTETPFITYHHNISFNVSPS